VTGVLLGGGAHEADVAVDVTPIEKQAATIRSV
jgi:hypothetical protein